MLNCLIRSQPSPNDNWTKRYKPNSKQSTRGHSITKTNDQLDNSRITVVNCESRICWLKTITLRTKVDFRLMITMLLLVSYIPNVCVGVFFILFYIFYRYVCLNVLQVILFTIPLEGTVSLIKSTVKQHLIHQRCVPIKNKEEFKISVILEIVIYI